MRLFNVIDMETNKTVLECKIESDIAKHFGLSTGYITSAADKGRTIKGKFILEPAEYKERIPSNSIPMSMWKKWDETCKIAHLVKAKKAHIVSKYINGEWKHYTEVHK